MCAGFTYPTTATYSCDNGSNEQVRTCQPDGTWTGVAPTMECGGRCNWNLPPVFGQGCLYTRDMPGYSYQTVQTQEECLNLCEERSHCTAAIWRGPGSVCYLTDVSTSNWQAADAWCLECNP